MERLKVDIIQEWKPPCDVRGVWEFIGFCNFYQRFVKNFAEVAQLLHDLTKLGAKWEWGPQQNHTFNTLKDIIVASPVLIHPDPEERFHVEMDASNYAYGAVLSQKSTKDHHQHPVAFFSKSMTPAEQNYGISDKEALAIVKALQHWRHWLEGTKIPIEILTDHQNLQYFTKPCMLNQRQLRWMDLLNHYNYVIQYRPGNKNGAADALSRHHELAPENPEEEEPTTLFPASRFAEMAAKTAQLNDQEFIECILAILEEAVLSDKQIQEQICKEVTRLPVPDNVTIVNGLPFHKDKIYVPEHPDIKRQILQLYHDSPITGHLGQSGTMELIRHVYWWSNTGKYIKDYITGCHTCGHNKHPNWQPKGTMQPLPTPEGPWQWTQSDHITGLPMSQGYDAIYVVMDRLTKMTHFIPTTTQAMAKDLMQLHLKHVWRLHGVPRVHNTDRGTTFTADYT